MMISPVFNLDNAKQRTGCERGEATQGTGQHCRVSAIHRTPGAVAYDSQSVSTTVKAAPCAARARLNQFTNCHIPKNFSSQHGFQC